MLLLLQAAAQQLPPIHVTVQQPPGLPFWETAIFSALIGTFFGIGSSVAMKFVKPAISNRLLRKTILKNLHQEFRMNYGALLDAIEIAGIYERATTPESKTAAAEMIGAIHDSITKDRFEHYRDIHKSAFYEADEGHYLGKFYLLFEKGTESFPNNAVILMIVAQFGKEYIEARGLPEVKQTKFFVDMLIK